MEGTPAHPGIIALKRFAPRFLILAIVAAWQSRSLFGDELIYRHDWAWPALVPQLLASRLVSEVPWNSDGLGAASIAPLHHVVFFVWSAVGFVLGTHVVLVIIVIGALCAFGLGIASCARRLWQAPETLAILAGILAQLGPPMINKLVAGHLDYLITLAMFPWFVRALAGGSRRPACAFLTAGLIAATAILQIQLYAVMVVGLLIAAFVKRETSPAIRVIAIVVALAQLVPEIYAVLSQDPQAADVWMIPRLPWELNNSSPFPDGLYLLGYSPHYAEQAMQAAGISGIVVMLLAVAAAIAIISSILHRSELKAQALFGGWLVCVLLVLGLYGPLAGILTASFSHIAAFAVFRELYHFAGPAWALEVLLVVGVAWNVLARRILTGYFALGVVAFGMMWSHSNFAGQLAVSPLSPAIASKIRAIALAPGDSRTLLWPAEWPIGPRDTELAGTDPLAYPMGMHPAANEYRLSGPLEVAAGLVREGHARQARQWFAAAGVGSIIDEPWTVAHIIQRFPPMPQLAPWMSGFFARARDSDSALSPTGPVCMLCAYKSLPVVDEPEQWNGGDAFLDSDLRSASGAKCAPSAAFASADPSRGWVDLENWSWLDSRLAMMGPGELTWSSSALGIPHCKYLAHDAHLLLLSGRLLLDGRPQPIKRGVPTWLALGPGFDHRIAVERGLLAIDGFASVPPRPRTPTSLHGTRGVALAFDWRSGTGTGVLAAGESWIVLKSRFSRHWQLSVEGGDVIEHIRASGYANAWKIHAAPGSRVTLWYDRWTTTEILSWGAFGIWLACLALITLHHRLIIVNA